MAMQPLRRTLVGISAAVGLAAVAGLALSLWGKAQAQNAEVTIQIIKSGGKFAFAETDKKIAKGQSIKWEDKQGIAPHDLVATKPKDAFKTGEFVGTSKSQEFKDAEVYEYMCTIHGSMKGKITVSDPRKAP
jgi:plastocyanin